jgi:hypothetical protein
LYFNNTPNGENGNFDSCKLILRPLSRITDSECLLIAENLQYAGAKTDKAGLEYIAECVRWGDYVFLGENAKSATFTIDYLRSLNFCVPFMGLDPVEEVWAWLRESMTSVKKIV